VRAGAYQDFADVRHYEKMTRRLSYIDLVHLDFETSCRTFLVVAKEEGSES
jgi:hypothetical protein